MMDLQTQERTILDNLAAGRRAFGGFSAEERADYAETVRIENEARAEHTVTEAPCPAHVASVPFVDVWYEDGIKLSNAVRVY